MAQKFDQYRNFEILFSKYENYIYNNLQNNFLKLYIGQKYMENF